MREIKFRGKRKTDGAWLYGSLVQVDGSCYIVSEKDFATSGCTPYDYEHVVTDRDQEVDGGTVGQLTYLTDFHGKEIYEGDVLVAACSKNPRYRSVVTWVARSSSWGQRYRGSTGEISHLVYAAPNTIVIGNIHDNPELMETCNKQTQD